MGVCALVALPWGGGSPGCKELGCRTPVGAGPQCPAVGHGAAPGDGADLSAEHALPS